MSTLKTFQIPKSYDMFPICTHNCHAINKLCLLHGMQVKSFYNDIEIIEKHVTLARRKLLSYYTRLLNM